ncbi:MAG: hypothetical protein QOH06_5293 [Acidobacteriota bacterium]|jgi:hypothetical protein|nr:hypothetical protein [Acidobacteriota bacterium]
MGHALILNVPEELYRSLIQRAEEVGQKPESLAVQLLKAATSPGVSDPLEPFIGALSSQRTDWADRHDAYLGKSPRR